MPILAAGAVFNEIAWMGTQNSSNDEWIELSNPTDSQINLEGWVLKTADEGIKITLKGFIPENGFYLLERTDDNTVPGITADLIYKGSLNNAGEVLELYDESGNLIDKVDCQKKWTAGNNSTKQTMERAGSAWQTSENPGGTPREKNSLISAQNLKIEQEKPPAEKTAALSNSASVNEVKKESQAAIAVPFQKENEGKPLPAIFFAIMLSLLSAAIILTLKRSLLKK